LSFFFKHWRIGNKIEGGKYAKSKPNKKIIPQIKKLEVNKKEIVLIIEMLKLIKVMLDYNFTDSNL